MLLEIIYYLKGLLFKFFNKCFFFVVVVFLFSK